MKNNYQWITFAQPDGTHAGLICPACVRTGLFNPLDNERAVPVTTEVDHLRKCSVCEIEVRDFRPVDALIQEIERGEDAEDFRRGMIASFFMVVSYLAFVVMIVAMLLAFFNLLD